MRQLGHREASKSLGDTQVAGGGGGVQKQAAWLFESAHLPTRGAAGLEKPCCKQQTLVRGFCARKWRRTAAVRFVLEAARSSCGADERPRTGFKATWEAERPLSHRSARG